MEKKVVAITDKQKNKDAWLSKTLKMPCYNIDSIGDIYEDGLYCLKVSTCDNHKLYSAQDFGFKVVDTKINLSYNIGNIPADTEEIRDYENRDREAVLSTSDFSSSRFHLDPLISKGAADTIKTEWILNACIGNRGIIRVFGDAPKGFLIETSSDVECRIDLLGVSKDHRRRGVGKKMVYDFIRRKRRDGKKMVVSTQVGNISAINLYISCGFLVNSTEFMLHLHRNTDGR